MKMIKIMLLLLMICILGTAGAAESHPTTAKPAEEKAPKKAILIISFGTSIPKAEKGITNLVNSTKKAFPDYEVRLAYTSNIIRKKIALERKINVPTPIEAMARLNDDGFTHVYVATTLVIPGEEFESVKSVANAFGEIEGKWAFKQVKVMSPFMGTIHGCEHMVDLLVKRFSKELAEKNTAIVLMGHGTPQHFSHALYAQLQVMLDEVAPSRFFVGTVERVPEIETIVKTLKKTGNKRVVLSPLMMVAGDHAANDMSDPDDKESWLSVLKAAGYKDIGFRMEGLGEDPRVAEFFVAKLKSLVK